MRSTGVILAALLAVGCGGGTGLGLTNNDNGNSNVPETCGDGVVDPGEGCDGDDLGGASCETLGAVGGTLACTAQCTFDEAGCDFIGPCGDGLVDTGEECDLDNLAGQTCETLGYDGGTLACSSSCQLEAGRCTLDSCGDGVIEGIEECDDANLDPGDGCGANCAVEDGFDCTGEPSVCVRLCGNMTIDPGEDCDRGNLGGASCQSLGFDRGTLACGLDCTYDTSQCGYDTCGNGTLDTGEDCDGADLNGADCVSLGFTGGTLSCTPNCGFDVSQCTGGTGCSATGGAMGCGDSGTGDTSGAPAVSLVDNWTGNNCPNWPLDGPEIIYSFSPGAQPENVQVDLTGLTGDLDLFVMEGSGLGCRPDLDCLDISYNGNADDEQIVFRAQAGGTYYIVVDGFQGASSPYNIDFTCVQPTRMVYEWFPLNTNDNWDLTGTTITFQPDAAAPNGYTYSVATGVTTFPTSLSPMSLAVPFTGPDDSFQNPFPAGQSFPFFGVSRSAVWINTHGTLTFGQGSLIYDETAVDFASGPPRIAGEWDRLNPTDPNGGQVWVTVLNDRVAITWDYVSDGYANQGDHAIQIELFWSGQIRITNLENGGFDGLCGLSEGGGAPGPEENFVP